jgi:hypothetical protein
VWALARLKQLLCALTHRQGLRLSSTKVVSKAEVAKAELSYAERFPLLQKLSRVEVRVRLWTYPSFDEWKSWTVIQADQGLLLRRLTWTQSRVPVSSPITTGAEALFPEEGWKQLESELEAQTIRPITKLSGIVLDGTWYGLACKSYQSSIEMQWQNQPPAEWKAVYGWWQKAVTIFDDLLPRHVVPRA